MSSKKKLIISLSVAAAVLVAAIIAIVAVFAAAQQTVNSTVSVKFTATDVACRVTGEWEVKNATEAAGQTGDLGEVIINANDPEGTSYTMTATPEIALTSAQNYVDFIYTFENRGSRGFSIKLAQAITSEDITVSFLNEGGSPITDANMMGTGENPQLVVCEPGNSETVSVTVRFTVKETSFAEDFDFSATIAWVLDSIVNQGE